MAETTQEMDHPETLASRDEPDLLKPRRNPPEGTEWHYDPQQHEWKAVPTKDTKKKEETEHNEDPVVMHTVQPTDTLAGLCLRYKITATQLRRANRFSGSNLSLAPSKLIIPDNNNETTMTRDEKMSALIKAVPKLGPKEARAYLEIGRWNLEATIETARNDWQWKPDRSLRKCTPLFSHFAVE